MKKHSGEHPRFGATDVCPLVPVSNITMEETVEYARKLAKEYLRDSDECFIYLSSCIGRSDIISATVKSVKDNKIKEEIIEIKDTPVEIIDKLMLKTPRYANMCKNGFFLDN